MASTSYALSVTQPIVVTDAMLVSTDVPEADHAAWSSGTTYALGDRVILTSTHKIYESLQGSNTAHDPVSSPTWWIEVSPTNRWKVFDTSNSTQTAQATSMAYRLTPGVAITSFAALHIDNATSIRVRLEDPTYGTVYDHTIDLTLVQPEPSWWSWFFSTRVAPDLSVFSDLPSFPQADILIDVEGGAGLAVGVMLFGQAQKIGLGVELGATTRIQDYSRKETNDFGDTILIQRAYSKLASFNMLLEKNDVDQVAQLLTRLRATPCLWVGHAQYNSTIVFGIYKDFEIQINYATHSDCTLELEGLT